MRNGRDPKSPAEQVHEKFLFARERRLISGSMVNVIEAWKARRNPRLCFRRVSAKHEETSCALEVETYR